MKPKSPASPQSTPSAAPGIRGKLIRAGTFPVRDEEVTGLVIQMTPEALAAIESLPLYREVVIAPADLAVKAAEVPEWAVNAARECWASELDLKTTAFIFERAAIIAKHAPAAPITRN